MDYRARPSKRLSLPHCRLSPPDCQKSTRRQTANAGRAEPPIRKRHHLYDFIFSDGKSADEARCAVVLTETCLRAVKNMRNKINRNDTELGYTPYNASQPLQTDTGRVGENRRGEALHTGRPLGSKTRYRNPSGRYAAGKMAAVPRLIENKRRLKRFRVRSLPAGYGIFTHPQT